MVRVFKKPEKNSIYIRQLILEIEKLGINSIGIVAVISVFMGGIITLQLTYNMVNRQRLYAIMLKKQILPPEEIDFLKILHDNLYFVGKDKRRVFLLNGVHQGSPISPALFNIYIEEVMARIQADLAGRNMWYKLHPDSS